MLIQSPTIKEGKSSIYFLETKIIWAFMPESGFGMDSQKLYANSSQRITIPRFMLLSYPYKVKVVYSDLFS